MLTAPARVAILLFTRPAHEEAAHKSFGGRAADSAVAAQLIARATATARQAGADFVCVESGTQWGRTFGQRLAAALTHGFALGYERLVVIGNDCPQLTPALVRQAVRLLHTTDAVLGPATDGGVYLLGVSKPFFEADTWATLPWQTTNLGAALRRYLHQAGAAVQALPQLSDVDNAHDLAQVLSQLPAGAFRHQLHYLLTAHRPAVAPRRPLWRVAAAAAPLPQRGPPAC